MPNVRLSPSGPVIGAGPTGSGTRIRLEENTAANSNQPITTTGIVTVAQVDDVSMLLPSPTRAYRARGRILVRNESDTNPAVLTARLQMSVDGSTGWTDVPTANVSSFEIGECHMVDINLDSTLGSALPVPITAGQAAVFFRIFLVASADDRLVTVGTSTYHLEVEELEA